MVGEPVGRGAFVGAHHGVEARVGVGARRGRFERHVSRQKDLPFVISLGGSQSLGRGRDTLTMTDRPKTTMIPACAATYHPGQQRLVFLSTVRCGNWERMLTATKLWAKLLVMMRWVGEIASAESKICASQSASLHVCVCTVRDSVYSWSPGRSAQSECSLRPDVR